MDEVALDIFRTDDFRATTMTELVNDIDYVPYELDAMGIFEEVFLRTTTVTLYQENGQLRRIPTTERGAPEPFSHRNGRVLRQLSGHRLAERDIIRSHEVQDVLNPHIPQTQRLETANDLIAERQQQLIDDMNYTKEFHRLGALQGVVYDADGVSVIDDWYEMFGIARPTNVMFDFDAYSAVEDQGKLRQMVDADIVTPGLRSLRRRRRPGTNYHALVGDEFWSMLSSSPAYERTMLTDAMRAQLNDDRSWTTITLGGVTWHHYYGDDDQKLAIASDEAAFFPMGAKDVFKVYYMPGENFAQANLPGLPLYSVTSPDYRPNYNEWVEVAVKSYPVFANLAPQSLFRGKLG
jgi:hypothetical protein